MGTRRSKHNKGRKPLYKEHRGAPCTDITMLSCPMANSDHVPVRLNMLGEKLNGFGPADFTAHSQYLKSSETRTMARRHGVASNGAQPRLLNSRKDTPILNQSDFYPNISTRTKLASAQKRDNSASQSELTIREHLSGITEDGLNGNTNSLTSCMTKESGLQRSQTISHALKKRSRPRSQLLREFTALDQSLEDSSPRESQDEKRPFIEYWKRPESILQLSLRAAKKVCKTAIKFGKDETIADDLSQDIAAHFYETNNDDRPKSEAEFEIWAYECAKSCLRERRYGNWRERQDSIVAPSDDDFSLSDLVYDSVLHHQRPFQDIRMAFLDAVRAINLLGDDDQRLVWSVIDGGDVVGYAKEKNVSLFDAMRDLSRCREIMKRLSDDLADDKKFATPPQEPR